MTPINSRSITILRIAAICAVIVLHFSSLWSKPSDGHRLFAQVITLLKAWSFWAVPVFILLSGYCLAERKTTVREFYRKRASRILLPLAAWSAFFLALRALTKTGLTWKSAGLSLLYGEPYYHLWFLFMLTGLYFATPLCWLLREKLREKSLIALGIFLIVVWCFPNWWSTPFFQSFPLRFVPYLGLFFLGMFLRELPVNRTAAFLSGGAALLYLLLVGPFNLSLLRQTGQWHPEWFLYTGPPAAFGAIAIFCFFLQLPDWREGAKSRKSVETVAAAVLGAYLVHPFFLLLTEKLIPRLPGSPAFLWIGCFGLLAANLALSFGVTLIAFRIPLLRRVFGKS